MKTEKIKGILNEMVYAFSLLSEYRDPYTAGHQQKVAMIAVDIANKLGLCQEKVEGVRVAAMLHDIGKCVLPLDILTKPGKINNLEYQLICSHSEIGYEIIKVISFPWPIAQMIRQHHERLDGSGYPDGLKGKNMLLESKIIGVSDVVEAMTYPRIYRPALGINEALKEVNSNSGKLYDADVVKACNEIFKYSIVI